MMDIEMVVRKMTVPGRTAIHQAVKRCERPAPSIWPRLVSGGLIPSPRKLREVSKRIVWGKLRVNWTINTLMMLGKMCRA